MGLIGKFAHEVCLWAKAVGLVVSRHADLLIGPIRQKSVPSRRFLVSRLAAGMDGRMTLGGESAKYAIRHGLPQKPGERTMAVENEPHEPSRFSGTIPAGYGAGEKRLVWYGTAVIRQGNRVSHGRVSYHVHDALRAGRHYDLAVDVEPGASSYDLYIPSGPARGWYRINRTIFGEKKWIWPVVRTRKPVVLYDSGSWKVQAAPEGLMLQRLPNRMITRLEEPGPLLPKPKTVLIDSARFGRLPLDSPEWVVERKFDGSLANAEVDLETGVAWMRSHRETGECYLGRLPELETLPPNRRRSPILLERLLWKPVARRVVLRGELVHPDGAHKVAGILNSSPEKAAAYQKGRGPVQFWAWDITEINGRDVSSLPYSQRRSLLEQVMDDLHQRNPNWNAIPRFQPGAWDEERFAREVETMPLPYGEGLVVKGPDGWYKFKRSDEFDLPIEEVLPGSGKYAGSMGRIVVRNPETGELGEVGSFELSDAERQWIWDHRHELKGQVIRVRALELTARGVPRAGVMTGFHPDKARTGNRMYLEVQE